MIDVSDLLSLHANKPHCNVQSSAVSVSSEQLHDTVSSLQLVTYGQSLGTQAQILNVLSEALIFDLGIVLDLFSRYLRKGGVVGWRQQLKLCC